MSETTLRSLHIGIPKEIMEDERRVAAAPEVVHQMVDAGALVTVQSGAGQGSYFTDDVYEAAGARLCEDPQDVFANADLILKVKEPRYNTILQRHEVDMLHEGQFLIAFLHPASPANHKMVKALADRGVISFTLDSIPRISRAQPMDALTSMSTVAGYKGLLMAANRLPKFMPMLGTAVGMIQPAEVLVVGAGVAGLQALATAKRLGARIKAADIRPEACEQAKSLGAGIIDVGIPSEVAVGSGGYARRLPSEWLTKEREALASHAAAADIIVLSALVPGKVAPVLITESMVEGMAPGSVIVDISADQGGNCELTEAGCRVQRHGILVDGTQNIPGTVPSSATAMFSKNVFNFLGYLVKDGKVQMNLEDPIIGETVVTYRGRIVHAGTREAMGLDSEGEEKT